jgi:hypothetical protein
MAYRDPSSPTAVPTSLRYGLAVLSVAIAIGLDFFLLRHFEASITSSFVRLFPSAQSAMLIWFI